MKERILYKLNSFMISLMFCMAIFIPFLIGIIEKDKDISKIEKRTLSKYPEVPQNLEDINKFPKLFDTYYSDYFGLRDWFNEKYKWVKFNLGDSPSKDVIIGQEGWLFLGSVKKGYNKYSDPIGDYRNVNLYSQNDLKRFAKYMTGLRSWLNEKDIEYVFVIAPNKHTVYFDKLPDYISKVNEHSATDQLVEYLKQYTDVPVVDLRSRLINEKDKHPLYYKTDTHWNSYAANIAQYEIMLVIETLFPKRIQAEIKKLQDGTKGGGDLVSFMGNHNFNEIHPQPVFEQTCTPKKHVYDKKARQQHTMICEDQKLNTVIFKDSFFDALEPYFSRKFKRSTYIKGKMNHSSLIASIELEKPDIVIEEWVERSLPYVPNIIHEFRRSLYKEIFNNSDELIFSNDWDNLKQNNCFSEKNAYLRLKSTDKCPVPIIKFSPLPFEPNNKYIVHIKMTSSVQSNLKIFFSEITNQSEQPFSEKNAIIYSVNKGDNDIYISLERQYLGKYLRLDPIHSPGEVTIKSLEIKKIGNYSA